MQEVYWNKPPSWDVIRATYNFQGATPTALEGAFRALLERYPVLCASFRMVNGALAVDTNPPSRFNLQIASHPMDGGTALSISEEFFEQPIRMSDPWVLRAKLLCRLTAVTLLIKVHHSVCDAASLAIMKREIGNFLATGSLDGKSGKERRKNALDFYGYARWERSWFLGQGGRAVAAYWREWLRDIPSLLTPSTRREVTSVPGHKVIYSCFLPSGIREKLLGVAARFTSTMFFVMLTAFALAICEWSGQRRFAVRSIGNLRTTPELVSVVGVLLCADPLEVCVPRDMGFVGLLRALSSEYLCSLKLRFPMNRANIGINEEEFDAKIGPTINYLNDSQPSPISSPQKANNEDSVWPEEVSVGTPIRWDYALRPILLYATEIDSGLMIRFEINNALISEREGKGLVHGFLAVLKAQCS